MSNGSKRTEIVKSKFLAATSRGDYRKALRMTEKLTGKEQILVLDALRDAAKRLDVEPTTGMPRVTPRGSVSVRGREVIVEVLS